MPSVQAVWWCFTLNNPEKNPEFIEGVHQYLVYQLEQGENGTPHLQGTVQFKSKKALKGAKATISERAHMEPMRASDPKASIDYCKKEEGRLDGPWEYGEVVFKGSHTRRNKRLLDEFRDDPEELQVRDPDAYNRIKVIKFNDEFYAKEQFSRESLDRPWQKKLLTSLESLPG